MAIILVYKYIGIMHFNERIPDVILILELTRFRDVVDYVLSDFLVQIEAMLARHKK